MKKVLAVIPARGGSKSVPKKNIKILNGKPLIAYTIELAKNCDFFSKVIVSTDCEEIATIANQYGAEVIKRPDEIANDTARTEDALLHVLKISELNNEFFSDVVTLEATSPLRTLETVNKILEYYFSKDADSLITLIEDRSFLWKKSNDIFVPLYSNQPRRRQEREALYKEAGVVYITKTEVLKKKQSVIGDKLIHFIVGEKESIDINTLLDFKVVEAYMREENE